MMRGTLVLLALLAAAPAAAQHAPPITTPTSRPIAALTAGQEVDLLAGRGSGLAKAAEANGWPGPLHVLELAMPLDLTPEQRRATEALFRGIGDRARSLGAELVTAERALDDGFRNRTIDADALSVAAARIGVLQGAVRQVHLAAHLEQTALLTARQIATYNRIRGNAAPASGQMTPDHRHGD